MEANKIQVIDDQGNEKEFEVLFTIVEKSLAVYMIIGYL